MGTSFPLSSYPLVQATLTPPLILSSAFYHLGGGVHMHIWGGYVTGKLSNIDTPSIDLASFNNLCPEM